MKSNGALKPRQGASIQGSSPGVVFKEYRVKRYFQVNKNVVNGLPLNNAGGAKNEKRFRENNVINRYYNSINNQQRTVTSLSRQLEHKGERAICKSLIRINCSTLIRIIKQNNYSTQNNTTQSGVSAACRNYLNNRSLPQKVTATAKVAEAVAETDTAAAIDTGKDTNIESEVSIQVDSESKAVINITARQKGKEKLQEQTVKNTNNCTTTNRGETEQVNKKVFEKQSHDNIIINNSNNSNNKAKQVCRFLLVAKINENPKLRAGIRRLKLMIIYIFLCAIRHFNGKSFNTRFAGSSRFAANICNRALCVYRLDFRPVGYNLAKIMSASQLLVGLFKSICLQNAKRAKSPVALIMVIYAATAILLPHAVVGDDGDTFFPINAIETTTPEFDYASRGQKKFGDKCENTLECGFPGSICDPKKKSCQCTEDLPVTNHIDKCGKEAAVNESCFFNEQCEVKYFQTECRDQRCVCRFDMTPAWLKDGSVECKGRGDKKGPETYIDPAMIGVLIGMALMFIIICVVLRLFSQARWRENRTIFNTPNPRLMNVSLLRESKLLHGQERRGSRMSVRAPSRQPSMASLRPHSPNPSLGKTGSRSNSHGSNASATSSRSTRSNCVSPAVITAGNNSHHERKGSTYQPHQHQHHHPQQQKLQTLQQEQELTLTQTNIISNPVAETVTVEIIEPEKFTKSSE